MRRRTHRTVFARGIDDAGGALGSRHMVGGPARDLEFRMLRVVAAGHMVMVFKQHRAVGGHQNGTEGFVARLQGLPGQRHAPRKVLLVLFVDHGGLLVLESGVCREWSKDIAVLAKQGRVAGLTRWRIRTGESSC
ncbi:hypothetical protein D3C71_1662890 [compost metagenome]